MSYIGQQLPADTFSGFTTDSFTGDGSATTFTLSKAPFSEDGLIVVINNVIQKPTTNFTVSGTTLTIVGTAVASSDVIYAIHTSGAVPSTLASKVDVNGVSDAIILDADGDSTISADTDDQIDFKLGGVDEMTMSSSGIVINESSNDRDVRIETNASTHGLFVDGGNDSVLINKSAPSANYNHAESLVPGFEMFGTSNTDHRLSAFTYGSADAGGHIMMFGKQRDATADSYTVVQADDQLGQIFFQGADGTHFINGAALRVYVESGVGANDMPANLRFYTNGGTTSTTERMRITSGGYFKASNDTDYYAVSSSFHEFNNDASNDQILTLTHHRTANQYGLFIKFNDGAPDNTTQWFIACHDNAAARFEVKTDGDVINHDNSYGQVSDERIKENITDANSQWDDLKNIKVVNFERKDDVTDYGAGKKVQIGVIAQEVEKVSPGLVKEQEPSANDIKMSSEFGTLYTADDAETKDGNDEVLYVAEDQEVIDGNKKVGDVKSEATHSKKIGDIKSTTGEKVKKVSYSVLYMKAIKALQEAMAKIETLETKVKALEDA